MKKSNQSTRRKSIKRSVLLFSVILFLLIFIGGSFIFIVSMTNTIQENTGHELQKALEIERIKLESSVNGEIAIAMKMADSPVIQTYFSNPYDPEFEQIAFMEIAGYRRAFVGNSVFWVNDIDHRFYSDDQYSHTLDVNDPNNYWYLMTLRETQKYNFNINYNADLNVTNLWINAPVFDSRRNPIGILGTGIDITSFVESIYKNYTGKAALYFFNENGEITGARDSKLVSNKETLFHYLGEVGNDILDNALALGSGEVRTFGSSIGEVAVGSVPALGWYIAAIQTIGIADILGSNMTFQFLTMIIVIAVIFVIFYVYISQMIMPMNDMVKTLDHISVDWDLTQKIKLRSHSKDEIGTLGEFFNLTFGKMKDLLVRIKGKTVSLTDTGEELTSYMIKTRKDLEGIDNNIQNMRKEVLSQADKVSDTANSMDRVMHGLDGLNKQISIQAESVSQSSSAIEEMLANIQSVTQTLVKNTGNIKSLAESSEAGRTDLHKVSDDIQEIAHESESLLQINSVMQTIASQTNLLAMNAAIEAAHAGESGKGFAVVADEIRKLAENSGKQSKTISAVLKKIKTMIDTITKSTSVVLERFSVIENEVETVSNQESQIRSAMEEQGQGSKQILDAVTQLNSVTGQVRKTSDEITTESKQVMNHSIDLKRITNDVAASMDDMAESAEAISSSITRVQEIADENKENITELNREISIFKVD